jgi:hypothetical protein
MPAALTTLAHLSISERMNAPHSSALPATGSAPWLFRRSTTSGVRNALTAAVFSFASASLGVAAGATRPYQPLAL